MSRRIFILLISFLAYYIPVEAQDSLSLQEAINVAAANSLASFKAATLYKASYWEYQSYRAQFKPSLRLNTTFLDYNRAFVRVYNSQQNANEYVEQKNIYSTINPSIVQNIPITGGTLTFDTELSRLRNYSTNSFTQFSTVPYRIKLAQPLGGFNSYRWQRKIAPMKYDKSKRDYVQSRETISLNTIDYYFNRLTAETKIAIAENNFLNADTLYKIGLERFAIASISQADVLTLKMNVSKTKNGLAEARKELQASAFAFNSFLRLREDATIRLEIPSQLASFQVDFHEALEIARKHNPALMEYNLRMLESQSSLDQAKRERFANSSISASIGLNQQNTQLAESYVDPLPQERFSLTISLPIIDGGQIRGRKNMAKMNYEITRLTVEQAEVDFQRKILMAVNNFNLQQEIVTGLYETMAVADQAYDITKQRFMIGKVDVNSLELALNRKDLATLNYLDGLRAYWQYYFSLRELTLYDFENHELLVQQLDTPAISKD